MKLKKYYGLIENFISFSLFKVIDAVIPLIVIPYLIVVVGKDNYGIYAFAYALVFYLLNIVQYGFSLSAVRLIALNRDNKKELDKIYSSVFTTQLYLAIVVLSILFGLTALIDKFNANAQVYYYFSFIIIGELLFPIWFFLGMERMRFITVVNLVSKSSFAVLTFLLIKEASDFVYISLYQSVGFLFAGLTAQIFIFYNFKIKLKLAAISEVKTMLKDGLSSFLTLVTPTIYSNTSIFLVGVFGIPSYVTFMEIGSKVSGAFGVLVKTLTHVLYPFINRNQAAMKKFSYVFLSVGFSLSLLMYFASEYLITLWLGQSAPEVVKVVKYLSPSPFLVSVISAFGVNGLMVKKKDTLYLKAVAIGSIAGFTACLILIPKYFYIGGAIAIILARSIKAILSYYYNSKIEIPSQHEA
ncbi:oligosaccharide flippase family protein [Winogradskyella sp. 3972H.M.0a.05]|uniref:oligosaccharide flippase family protein n=1 Tax=Winogradskyella sp. 3972H.M.0a.05 TaxID=2950277 RepID=UPI0033992DED